MGRRRIEGARSSRGIDVGRAGGSTARRTRPEPPRRSSRWLAPEVPHGPDEERAQNGSRAKRRDDGSLEHLLHVVDELEDRPVALIAPADIGDDVARAEKGRA